MTDPSVISMVSSSAGTPAWASRLAMVAGEVGVVQVAGADVDGDWQSYALVEPAAAEAEGLVDDGGGEPVDEGAAFGHGDELGRREQTAGGVLPAHEGFDAEQFAGVDGDLGLVEEDEFIVVEGLAELADQREAVEGAVVVAGGEVGEAGPVGFRFVHGDIGLAEQFLEGRLFVAAVLPAMPMLASMPTVASPRRNGASRARAIRVATRAPAAGPPSVSSSTNSSPPKRATVSPSRRTRLVAGRIGPRCHFRGAPGRAARRPGKAERSPWW